MSRYTHWACFNCRKSFQYPPRAKVQVARKCAECEGTLEDMGVYFEPPGKRAKKAWQIMELLWMNGYRFASEGSKAYVDAFILKGAGNRVDEIRRRIELESEARERSRIRERVRWSKLAKKHVTARRGR